jgi:hypothetical protein
MGGISSQLKPPTIFYKLFTFMKNFMKFKKFAAILLAVSLFLSTMSMPAAKADMEKVEFTIKIYNEYTFNIGSRSSIEILDGCVKHNSIHCKGDFLWLENTKITLKISRPWWCLWCSSHLKFSQIRYY